MRSVAKSNSTSALFNMATVTRAPGLPESQLHSPSEGMSTLPDPRSPSISSENSSRGSTSPRHPDLSSEVANLSNKLINAINHQTHLDDSLAATRHELESARERIRQLEAKAQEHAEMVAKGILVKKADVDDQTVSLMAKLSEERKQRSVAEKDKKLIEQELEGLTEVLFEEANKVILAPWDCRCPCSLHVDGCGSTQRTGGCTGGGGAEERPTADEAQRHGDPSRFASRPIGRAQSRHAADEFRP